MPCAMPPCRCPSAMQRVEDGAGVVDGDDLVDDRLARLHVDERDGDVRAERERRRTRVEPGVDAQLLALGEVGQRHGGVRAAHDDRAPLHHEVVDVRLQQVGRPLLGHLHQLARRLVDGHAAGLQAAASPWCRSRGGSRSVSPCLTVIFSIGMPRCSLASIAQAVRVPLAVRGGAGEHGDRAVGVHLDRGALLERRRPPVISTNTDTPMPICTASPRSRRAACSARRSA